MEPEQTQSKWSVIELLAVTVSKTCSDHRVDIPGKRDQVYTPSLQLPPPEVRSMERNRTSRYTRLMEEVFIPGRIQACGRKDKRYKNDDPHKNGDLS